MHRNLASNNILLTTSLVAKVWNFGATKVVSPLSSDKLATAPGTIHFMSPEALVGHPHYGLPLDVFSFGCVVCHVISEEPPRLLSDVPTYSSMHGRQEALSEAQRRQHYIDQISERSLKQLVITCLDNDQERRPLISVVSERITSIITGQLTSLYCELVTFIIV